MQKIFLRYQCLFLARFRLPEQKINLFARFQKVQFSLGALSNASLRYRYFRHPLASNEGGRYRIGTCCRSIGLCHQSSTVNEKKDGFFYHTTASSYAMPREPSGEFGKNATAQATTPTKSTPTTKQEGLMKKKGLEYETNYVTKETRWLNPWNSTCYTWNLHRQSN